MAEPEHSADDPFPTAAEDAGRAQPAVSTAQTRAPSYRLAYTDTDFLLRDELRGVRLELELMKPELALNDFGVESTVVVFGSARVPATDEGGTVPRPSSAAGYSRYYDLARRFARLVSEAGQEHAPRRHVVVTGGGPGIMEAANRGAEDVGAVSIGLNIVLPAEQVPNPYITPELCFQFHYFAIRKMHFLMRAQALVLFPGGFGTLDELFDALTLVQTGKIWPLPILLFGESYWRRVLDLEFMAAEGMISPEDVALVEYVETPEQAWQRIRAFQDGR